MSDRFGWSEGDAVVTNPDGTPVGLTDPDALESFQWARRLINEDADQAEIEAAIQDAEELFTPSGPALRALWADAQPGFDGPIGPVEAPRPKAPARGRRR